LSNLTTSIPPDGLLLISFAGHGMEREGQAFLLPEDAQVGNDIELLEQTAINVVQIKDRVRRTRVKQVVMILDACRNDPVGRADADNPLSRAYLQGFSFDLKNQEVIAFATLYATAVGHRAYEYKEKRQGYFTWTLVEGLKGGAANARGEVTLLGLKNYLEERVPKQVLLDLGPGKEQRPWAEIEGYRADELVISLAENRSAPNQQTSSPAPPANETSAQLAYWNRIKNSADPKDFQSYLEKYPTGQFADLARIRASRTAPSIPTARQAAQKAEAYFNEEKFLEAEVQYREAVRLEPQNVNFRLGLGRTLEALGKWESAEANYREGLRSVPANFELRAALAGVISEQISPVKGDVFNQQRMADYEAVVREAIQTDPANSAAHLLLAKALQMQTRLKEAELEYREAMRLNPTDAAGYLELSTLLSSDRRWAEAETVLRKLITIEPNDASNYFQLGLALHQQRKWSEAEGAYQEAVRLNPQNTSYSQFLEWARKKKKL